MKTVPFPDRKDLVKVFAVQAMRHNRRDKARKFRHVNVSAQHFVCKFAQNHRRGIQGTSDLNRVNGRLGLTCGVKAEVIYRGIHNPGDLRLPRMALAHEPFIAGRG